MLLIKEWKENLKLLIELEITKSLYQSMEDISSYWQNLEEDGVSPFRNWTWQQSLQATIDLMELDKEFEIKAKQLKKIQKEESEKQKW